MLALAVDYAGPVAHYRTPGLGRSRTEEWTIAGSHFAERCQLFVIIALGESILVTGTTFGEIEISAGTVAAFVVAFAGSAALWWTYFARSARDASETIPRVYCPAGRLLVGRGRRGGRAEHRRASFTTKDPTYSGGPDMTGNVEEEVLKVYTPGRNAVGFVLGGAMAPVAYRYAVEGVVRFAFGRLSAGDYQTLLKACASDVEHTFSGEHALGGTRHSKEALERWFERLYRLFPGLDFEVKRVLVRGWPWRTVAVIEWVDRACPADGSAYVNEGCHVLRFSWGRLVGLHAYLDTQRVEEVLERLAKEGIEEASAPPILT